MKQNRLIWYEPFLPLYLYFRSFLIFDSQRLLFFALFKVFLQERVHDLFGLLLCVESPAVVVLGGKIPI